MVSRKAYRPSSKASTWSIRYARPPRDVGPHRAGSRFINDQVTDEVVEIPVLQTPLITSEGVPSGSVDRFVALRRST